MDIVKNAEDGMRNRRQRWVAALRRQAYQRWLEKARAYQKRRADQLAKAQAFALKRQQDEEQRQERVRQARFRQRAARDARRR
tara:strand:- start:640 stop:888 length:249 start_codon:yes stop_codon:yes gene_type:complete